MKKVIFALAAVVALAACSKEQTISFDKGDAIGFNTFVENSTRSVYDPSYTNANMFSDFAVFGYVEGAVLLDGVRVAKDGAGMNANNYAGQTKTGWKYEGTQYWIAGANYNFNAVAPMTNGGWTKVDDGTNKDATKLTFTNNGTTDLLYATTTQQGAVSDNNAVEFEFRHVLSKVKFSFENAYNATNATIKVKNIVVTNAHKTANVVLTDNTAWDGHATAEGFTLDFGMATDDEATADVKENVEVAYAYGKTYESQNELFLIPSNTYEYEVTFTVELLVSSSVVATYEHTAIAKFAPAAGNAYDIKTAINASNIDPQHKQEPIEFTVYSLGGWDNGNTVDSTTNDEETEKDYYPLN